MPRISRRRRRGELSELQMIRRDGIDVRSTPDASVGPFLGRDSLTRRFTIGKRVNPINVADLLRDVQAVD